MLQFPDSVYTSTGSSEVLPLLLDAVDPEKLVTVQFLRGGRVCLTSFPELWYVSFSVFPATLLGD